jgi:hypothetical protein
MTFTTSILKWEAGFGPHHSDLLARCQPFPKAFS